MPLLLSLAAYFLLFGAAWAQRADPGFSTDDGTQNTRLLAGRWINEFLFAEAGQMPQPFWQIVEFRRDGQTTHDYFSNDPRLQPAAIPYTRISSTWSVGTFVDPQESKGHFAVIRIQPSAQINYDSARMRFQRITGNFGPQFRRFALLDDGIQLSLSELVILEVPGNIVISFPTDARDMLFERLPPPSSAVQKNSWGQLKVQSTAALEH